MRRNVTFLLLLLAAGLCLLPGCRSTSMPEETRAFIDSSWALYRQNDPEWPDAGAKWISMGRAERMILIELLFKEVVDVSSKMRRTPSGDLESAWLKPAREMVKMEEECAPYLIEALRLLKLGNKGTVEACTSMLAEVADFTMLIEAIEEDRENPFFRARIVGVLARLDDRRVTPAIIDTLLGPCNWQARAKAAEVLRTCLRSDRPAAIEALEKAVNDPDPTVARNARESLERLRSLENDG